MLTDKEKMELYNLRRRVVSQKEEIKRIADYRGGQFMAKAQSITVDIRVSIPDDTICRCLRILEMWMDDNPDKQIVIDQEAMTDGYRHRIRVRNRYEENDT